MKKTIVIIIIFMGLLTNSLWSQEKQVKKASETANIYADAIERIILKKDRRKDSISQQLEFPSVDKKKKFTLIGRVDYFSPSEGIFKTVYDSGLSYGADLVISIVGKISLYFGASYFSKSGEMDPLGEDTTITIIPIEAGAVFKFMNSKITPYAGGGIGYYLLTEDSFLGKVSASNIGFFVRGGVMIHLMGVLAVDLSIKYNSCNTTIDSITNNIGGIKIGAGIGLSF